MKDNFFEMVNLPSIVKAITPHVNINISNRYMSVKGAFGMGSFGFMTWSGYCLCVKKPWHRQLMAAVGFGVVYEALDYKDSKINAKTPTKNSSGDDKNDGTPVSNMPQSVTSKPFELKTYSQLNDTPPRNSDVWFVQGFVAIGLVNWLLGGAGVGKSIFMVQIAVAVSSGTRIEFLPEDSHIPRKTQVVFYRIEVFNNEYSCKYGNGETLEKSGIRWRDRNELSALNYQGLVDDLKQMIEALSEDTLVCIDPVTKLPDFDAGKFAEEAEKLMNRAKEKGFRLTFFCSAHLDEKEPWKSVTTVDVRGGDRLIQTAGSAFAIRKEKTDETSRYLKRLKPPKGYADDDNVLVCKLVSGNKYPHAEYVVHKSEAEALPLKPKAEGEKSAKETTSEAATPKRKPNIVWSEEMNGKLKELHANSMNDSQIAKTMNEEYGYALSSTQIDRQLIKCGLRPPKPGGKKK